MSGTIVTNDTHLPGQASTIAWTLRQREKALGIERVTYNVNLESQEVTITMTLPIKVTVGDPADTPNSGGWTIVDYLES